MAALLVSITGIGAAVGPIIGTLLDKAFGFRLMCLFVGLACMLFAFIYFFVCEGYEALRTSWRDRRKEMDLKKASGKNDEEEIPCLRDYDVDTESEVTC